MSVREAKFTRNKGKKLLKDDKDESRELEIATTSNRKREVSISVAKEAYPAPPEVDRSLEEEDENDKDSKWNVAFGSKRESKENNDARSTAFGFKSEHFG